MRGFGWQALLGIVTIVAPAAAQDRPLPDAPPPAPAPDPDTVPTRVMISLGPQFQPWFPGDDRMRLSPAFGLSRTRGDKPFAFGGPDDGTNLTLLRAGRSEFGLAARREGRRRTGELVPGLSPVGRTLEAGVYAETWIGDNLRWHGDVRKGIGGHHGWVSQLGMDYVRRDADRWVVSLGPRVILGDARYQRSWFGVSDADATATGLSRFRPGGGVNSLGAASGVTVALTPHWGLSGQAVYARLIDDPARSPIIRRVDSRDQLSLSLTLNYTFTIRLPDHGIWRLIR